MGKMFDVSCMHDFLDNVIVTGVTKLYSFVRTVAHKKTYFTHVQHTWDFWNVHKTFLTFSNTRSQLFTHSLSFVTERAKGKDFTFITIMLMLFLCVKSASKITDGNSFLDYSTALDYRQEIFEVEIETSFQMFKNPVRNVFL